MRCPINGPTKGRYKKTRRKARRQAEGRDKRQKQRKTEQSHIQLAGQGLHNRYKEDRDRRTKEKCQYNQKKGKMAVKQLLYHNKVTQPTQNDRAQAGGGASSAWRAIGHHDKKYGRSKQVYCAGYPAVYLAPPSVDGYASMCLRVG